MLRTFVSIVNHLGPNLTIVVVVEVAGYRKTKLIITTKVSC
jgi:hypothetical protein